MKAVWSGGGGGVGREPGGNETEGDRDGRKPFIVHLFIFGFNSHVDILYFKK